MAAHSRYKRPWPFPGDPPVVRARKIALAYRTLAEQQEQVMAELRKLLGENDPGDAAIEGLGATVEALDQRFRQWGETWHAGATQHYDLDDMVSGPIAADLLHVSKGAISRLRATGRLKGEWRGGQKGYYFKVRDVYAMSEDPRWRRRGTIDSIPDNGERPPA